MNITELNEGTLWALLSDIAELMCKHHKEDNELTMFLYLFHSELLKEIHKRIIDCEV